VRMGRTTIQIELHLNFLLFSNNIWISNKITNKMFAYARISTIFVICFRWNSTSISALAMDSRFPVKISGTKPSGFSSPIWTRWTPLLLTTSCFDQ
jgi:hypothetical protein